MNNITKQRSFKVFLICFLVVLSILSIFASELSRRKYSNETLENTPVYFTGEDLERLKELLPGNRYQQLPIQVEEYFNSIGYEFKPDTEISSEMRIIKDSVEEKNGVILFRCFFLSNDKKNLVGIYDLDLDHFEFYIEEQKE